MTFHTRAFVTDLPYYEDRARGLLEVLADGAAPTVEQVRSWHPNYSGQSEADIVRAAEMGMFTLDDARLVYAREHGFDSWDHLTAHVSGLAHGAVREPFMDVIAAGRTGEWSRVIDLLQRHPDLLRARGTNGNTLLNLACSLLGCADGGGTRLAPIQLLLDAGADPNQPNDRGWTPLHQAAYCADREMARLLHGAGARVDAEAHGSGGTPLAVALFWGHREVADELASIDVVPANLRIASGLERTDLIDRCFVGDVLTDSARAARRFYRPHSGFPRWRPSDDAQEVLDEALVWAAKADRAEAMARLVERGARVDADPYRGTPLIWAAANGRLAAAKWLVDNGADVNQRATFGGPAHGRGVTALHLAAQDDRVAVAEFLLACGADPTVQDDIYQSTPGGWAEHFESRRVASLLSGKGGTATNSE